MRIILRRGNGDVIALSVPVIVTVVLVVLAALGGGGVAAVHALAPDKAAKTAERMGPKKNYAALPDMTFAIGGGVGGRTIDLRVLVELDPKENPKVTEPYAPRIADRLGDRIRQIEPDRLTGAEGAKLLKSTIASVVDREVGSVRVRDVLLERMVIH